MNLHEGIFHLLSWLVFCRSRFVLCAVDGPLFYSTDSMSIISHFSARKGKMLFYEYLQCR